MGLFDVLDDIAERNVIKTETGNNRMFGIVVGEVVDNYDAERAGRVCVSIQTRDAEANVLKWARVAFPYIGSGWGMYYFPEVGDQVLVAFDGGNIERPYVIGSIPKDSDKFLKASKHEKNKKKRIVTKNGNTIQITDGTSEDDIAETPAIPDASDPAGAAGSVVGGVDPSNPAGAVPGGDTMEGDKIEIFTKDEQHSIVMDDGKKLIEIMDKDKKCHVQMKTLDGKMTINAARKLTIKVGETIKITMNGDSGKVLIEAQDVKIDSTGKVGISATGNAEFTGANVSVKSNSALKLSASTMVSVEGKPIKLG